MDTSKDSAFDADMALTNTASSKKSTPTALSPSPTASGSTTSSYSSSRSREKKRKSLEDKKVSPEANGRKRENSTEGEPAKKKRTFKKVERKVTKRVAMSANTENKKLDNMYKPKECMKHMKIEVHPSLLKAWYMQDLQREVNRAGCQLSADDDVCDASLLVWTRGVTPTITSELGLKTKERCNHALYIMTADEVADKVSEFSLSPHVAEMRQMADCELIVIVFGVKDYFKDTGRKTKNSRRIMSEISLELALVDMLVTTGCDYILMDTPNDLALLIVQFTKAIAETPHKKAKRLIDEQAEFYMRGDNKKCVRVDSNGNGLSGLWQQMVAILPNSSLEISRAVCREYKSPLELFEACQSPIGSSSLSNLLVSRSAVCTSRARRLGAELARRLNILVTSRDGGELVE